MAGDWIKMRCDLAEDPAVITISEAVELDEFAVVGRLHRIWSWASAHSADGKAHVSAARIDKIAQCDGFAAAMESAGWLRIANGSDGPCITIPAFDRHNSKSAKRRASEASRKKSVRKASARRADKMRTREEKRREENIDTAASAAVSAPASRNASETAAEFPVFACNGKPGQRRWTLTEEHVAKLCEAFPGVAVRGECRKAWQWIEANPSKRKTANGMSDFLFRWMTREQNRNRSQTPPPRGRPTVAEHNDPAFREVFGDDDDDRSENDRQTSPAPQGLL